MTESDEGDEVLATEGARSDGSDKKAKPKSFAGTNPVGGKQTGK
jgi:hypothetical protein